MTDPLSVRDERFAAIQDEALERHPLADEGRPGFRARPRSPALAELAWLGAVLASLDPPQ